MGRELWQQGSDELLAELRSLEQRMRRDYAAALDVIAELENRSAANEHGYPGLAELLRDLVGISTAEANRRIRHAHAVTGVVAVSGGAVSAPLPRTAAALRAGQLGPEHVEVIARTLTGLPAGAVADAEHILVNASASLDARAVGRLGAQLRARLDQDGSPPTDAELANPVNELRLTRRASGRVAFTGELEPDACALLQTLLSPLAKPRPGSEDGPDPRSPAERQGDALVEILHLAADTGGIPSEAGEKPHLMVTVPLQALRDGLGPVLLGGTDHLDARSARRIACDSKLIPAVLGAYSEPLDVGRASYTVPTALRRALILRDGGCAFPGCDRPHQWCHAHHITHWADGGATALDNLVLVCGHHHRLLHHSAWQCDIVDGRAAFCPPACIDPRRQPRHNPLNPRAA